ncbi:hypothetical protein BDZ94DRAFT_1267836 [Collybia nuda]|uniref:Uncharacterized protein n=1 Tax=Collybia nuda TaxID=64659 RepID=A0A9P6CBL9_9AGAR|nr:hypothetical protein BDZ94DRAFT_1267836 [Collybia nuda]
MFQAMVWRSAMMRSATKSIDSVFSIMGLFGVQLDPAKYNTQSEALFALLQNILKNGGTVNWLAASVVMPGLLPILPTLC